MMISRKLGVVVAISVCIVASWAYVVSNRPRAQGPWDGLTTVDATPRDQASGTGVHLQANVEGSVRPAVSRSANSADLDRIRSSRIAESFEDLLEKARKDPSLAYALASALHTCSGADKAYGRLSRDAELKTVNAEKKLAEYDAKYGMCAGLTTAQLDFQFELMAAAARAGVLDAQLHYRDVVDEALQSKYAMRQPNAMDEMRENLESFLLAAAQTGNPEALYQAYNMYKKGWMVRRNPVRAYELYQQYARAAANGADATQARMIQAELARLRAQLTAEQLSQATSP